MCPCPEEGCSNLPGVEVYSHSRIHYCSVPREPSFPASLVGLSLFLIRPSSLEYGTSLVGKERPKCKKRSLSLSHGTCTWKNLHHMSSRPILNPDLNLCMKTRVCNFPIFRHFAAHAPPLSFNTTISSKPFVNLEGFMATTLVQPSIADTHVKPLIFRTIHITKLQRYVAAGIRSRINGSRFVGTPLGFRHITVTKVAEQSSGLLGDETVSQNKTALYQAVEGINRGIFGIPSAKKSEIETLVKNLESQNPTPDPTLKLEKLAGCWRLVYSTISILGSKRTKLGLRDFVSLDEFFQTIDVAKSKAVNTIKFSAKGLSLLNGQLSIEASYEIASTTRVAINFESSKITPDQLMNVFRKNYDVLLGIFNPEGWLEITYVDDSLRIGRDDKGNIFVLERFEDNNS